MVEPAPTKTSDEAKLYPEILYFAKRYSQSGGQPVFKRHLPDGEKHRLHPGASQNLYNHSPDGFQWGYCGSGPAQLALALLLDVTTVPDIALTHYQQFKWDKVSAWGDEWLISRSEILLWIELEKKSELEAMLNKN